MRKFIHAQQLYVKNFSEIQDDVLYYGTLMELITIGSAANAEIEPQDEFDSR